ncbi:hypothetical protein Pmar_PMAR006909 [Perkinsus marinus ATCC 50983]|uniref:Small nuclear ribonucleoprotein Prp3 C-terminal domain-containing protein n=1 Tax=Perkinsus marinus (strain ATCC 50983 / TXsc) TaxID=423536 RepID=C5KJS2_PERM5|nr:hypothetical protein Pmar_PMAR006909 [Perkinsus marinus ATCC 50983]EER15180.1 hypothetical protein Pmar_PMAR006909 [Perkinsus marinus ATCC 50983]|eukprot:XP_002783384.1 hypothetical protein Pmar_PMAR006909 [Perkinsus marinus ATCC 50983]
MSAAAVAWFHLQLEEAEAICAAYEDDCDFIWLHKPEGPDDGETAYAVTVRGKVDAETSVTFMITLPHGYPSAGEEKAFPEITAVEGSENVKYKLGNLQELLAANVRSQMKSAYEFPVLAALAPISDRLTKLGEEWQTKQQEEMAAKEDYDSVVRAAVKAKKSELQKGPLMLGRRMIFFHHIRSPYKRRCIQKWANDLRLGGMSKIGFPGCIVVEGDERDVSEYVNMVSK